MDAMKRIIAVMLTVVLTAAIALTACSQSDPVIGFWVINHVTAGDVEMNAKDAESIGLTAIGTVKLQKSGNCEIELLGEKSEGTWEQAEDGTITIKYGNDLTLSGTVDDKGVMTLEDPQGTEYSLSK